MRAGHNLCPSQGSLGGLWHPSSTWNAVPSFWNDSLNCGCVYHCALLSVTWVLFVQSKLLAKLVISTLVSSIWKWLQAFPKGRSCLLDSSMLLNHRYSVASFDKPTPEDLSYGTFLTPLHPGPDSWVMIILGYNFLQNTINKGIRLFAVQI